jgi:transcription initiation factor TFIIIB Brf1 subunit/transcription initiation factor TFIIB
MTIFSPKTIIIIEASGKKLKLDDKIISRAKTLYTEVTKSKEIQTMHTTQDAMAVACLYVSSALSGKKPTQYELTYKLKISPTTIRKVYKKICEVSNIERSRINTRIKPKSTKSSSFKSDVNPSPSSPNPPLVQ